MRSSRPAATRLRGLPCAELQALAPTSDVIPARGTPRRSRRRDPVAGIHIPETAAQAPWVPAVAGTTTVVEETQADLAPASGDAERAARRFSVAATSTSKVSGSSTTP